MENAHVTLIVNRLDSIERSITEERRDSSESRRRVYDKLEGQDLKLERLDMRVETLEKAILTMSPTVAEFLTMKEQARGAGRFGRFLWGLAAFSLTAAASVASTWAWLSGLFTGRP